MAPSGESVYFPPLETCLSSGHQLISWKAVFIAFTNPESAEFIAPHAALGRFFSDPEVRAIVKQPWNLCSPPSPRAKSLFETKTAAINVTPATHGQYNITEIKEDALWLSNELKIDEVDALRIVIQEWQSRPAVQLVSGFSEEEIASIQDASGVENLRSSVGGARVSSLFATVGSQAAHTSAFLQLGQRRSRFLDVYLSERRHALKVYQVLYSFSWCVDLRESTGDHPSRSHRNPQWLQEVAGPLSPMHDSELRDLNAQLVQLIAAVESRVKGLEEGSGWLREEQGDREAEGLWGTNMIVEMTHLMQLMFLNLQSVTGLTSSETAQTWFRLMIQYNFFETFTPSSPKEIEVLVPFQTYIAIVSLAILQLPQSIQAIGDREAKKQTVPYTGGRRPFIADEEAIAAISELLMNAAGSCIVTASPAVFAWAMILHTLWAAAVDERESLQSQIDMDATQSPANVESTLYQSLHEIIKGNPDEDPVTFLARRATEDCDVFNAISVLCENMNTLSDPSSLDKTCGWVRIMFLELMRVALDFLEYLPEPVSAVLSILTVPRGAQNTPSAMGSSSADDPRSFFLEDQDLMDKFFRVAQSRFPYEALPFLKLSRALATSNFNDADGTPFVALALRDATWFTLKNPDNFEGFQTIREDENMNFVRLNRPLEMIPVRPLRAIGTQRLNSTAVAPLQPYSLPAGTLGRIVSDDAKHAVIMWDHQYQSLTYLGKWLEIFSSDHPMDASESPEAIAVEIIGLLAALLESTTNTTKQGSRSSGTSEEARVILEIASDGIDRNGDVISIVFGIFEQELQKLVRASGERPLDLSLVCLQFLQMTVKVLPGRVWPFLARSTFLGIEGRGGMLGSILSTLEIPSGNYDFLQSSIQLFTALVEDAISNAVIRKGVVEVRSRTPNSNLSYAGTPAHILTKVLYTFGQILAEVYESSASWRFDDDLQRLEINSSLASAFDNILYYSYGIDEANDIKSRVTSVLSTFAPYLLDFFLAQSSRDITFNPLLRVLFDAITTPQSTLYLIPRQLWVSQVQAALKLSNTLVRAGRLLAYPTSSLEKQLFKASPVLVRLYASEEDYKHSIIPLLESLVNDAGNQEGDPPSLLGNLGTVTARNFGDCLTTFDKPLGDAELEIRIWNLLSALVSNRQQWIAIVLLTGSTPRTTLTQKGSSTEDSMRSKSLLDTAVNVISNLETLEPRLAIAALGFIALTQEYWPWTVGNFDRYPQFLPLLHDYMSKLEYANNSMISNCYTAKIASLIADIFAVNLHHSRQSSRELTSRQVSEFKTSLPWLVENGAHATGYNFSLQQNLEKNLAQKYPGCKLMSFKRAPLRRLDLGKEFFYDSNIAGKLLSYDVAWKGLSNGEGFEGEFRRANINLSKFESQMQLLHSWKFLASELCHPLIRDEAFQSMMVQVVITCLNANLRDDSVEAIFASLRLTRAELALEILQRLTEVARNVPPDDKQAIVAKAVEAIRATGEGFAEALLNGHLDYYRTLLRVLFLSVQCLTLEGPTATNGAGNEDGHRLPKRPDILSVVQEILTLVVAKGFRDLTSHLHEDPDQGAPPDFAILDALLRSCLQVKDVDRIYEPIVSHFGQHGAARSAITLFSYGERLTYDGDPIYGDLSIRFLLQLSTIPAMAEELAVEGLLSNISSAALTNYFRRQKGSGPFDQPARMFSIWASGLLPICINLLGSVGRSMAPEISSFLNQFQPQLIRATTSFANKYMAPSRSVQKAAAGSITLSMAAESNALALIAFMLENYRLAGASAGVDAQEIAELKWDGKQVREDIEELLGNREGLRLRMVATDEKEMELLQAQPVDASSGAQSKLEERMVKELAGAMMCLGGRAE